MKTKSSAVWGVAAASAMMLGVCGGSVAEAAGWDGAQAGAGAASDGAAGTAARAESAATATATVDPASQVVRLDTVQGRLSYGQGAVDSVDDIARVFKKAPAYLCGASSEQLAVRGEADSASAAGEAAVANELTVTGDVQHVFAAPLDDLASDDDHPVVLGCSCGGNPADGRASVSAEVTGVTIRSLLERAQVSEGANTIVFTSRDGYETTLPLSYVTQRYSLIVYAVNGEAVDNAMGGSNQLWLGSTSARYFVRDVASIELRTQETPPPAPGSAAARDQAKNVPNASVLEGRSA